VDQVLFYSNDDHGLLKLAPIPILNQCVKEPIKGTNGANWIATAAVKSAIHPNREGPKEANEKCFGNCLSTGHRTVNYCIKCDILICYNSLRWGGTFT
jgi:hypothetical protein